MGEVFEKNVGDDYFFDVYSNVSRKMGHLWLNFASENPTVTQMIKKIAKMKKLLITPNHGAVTSEFCTVNKLMNLRNKFLCL